jgi:hypothetical protein
MTGLVADPRVVGRHGRGLAAALGPAKGFPHHGAARSPACLHGRSGGTARPTKYISLAESGAVLAP